MKISKPIIISLINLIAILTLTFVLFLYFFNEKKTIPTIVHFNNARVFSEIDLSKEISRLASLEISPQKKRVDSLAGIIRSEERPKQRTILEQQLIMENEKLLKMNEQLSKQSNYQIWSRINSYAQEFGTLNNYNLILGTTGNGNLMYSKSSLDATDDFIKFINQRYAGN